jgi:putative PIN family toxin of toxin-antitoxin system
MKVVLDANIYVSSMVNTQGNPKRIISAWQQGAFDVLISSAILDEIERVLRYPRIVKRHKQDETAIQRFLKLLENEAIIVEPTDVLGIVKDDESDNRYLECAVKGKAQYVISGDKHLLEIGEYRGIVILPPAAFVAILSREGI